MNKDHVIFIEDGASTHYTNIVRDLLNNAFLGRWNRRRGPYDWPACSPDLTPCDFFLWGWAKDENYRREPRIIDELEDVIHDVISNVPLKFLRRAVTEEKRYHGVYKSSSKWRWLCGSVIPNHQDGGYLISTDISTC